MIDENIVRMVRNVDMISFLEAHCDFRFELLGVSYRCYKHPSLAVKEDRLSWFWHSMGQGGFGAIDWLIKIEKVPFPAAVEIVLNSHPTASPQTELPIPRQLILPNKRPSTLQLFNYLCNLRGIHTGIVATLFREEKLYEDRRGNVVFVGHDETGVARFASLRSTGFSRFRMDCAGSDKRYGFHMDARNEESNILYVFESPVDAMSQASLVNIQASNPDAWQKDYRLSLAGTTDIALPFFLDQHPNVIELVFCLDSDPAGRTTAERIAQKYSDMGYMTRLELPALKDFNNDLCYLSRKKS